MIPYLLILSGTNRNTDFFVTIVEVHIENVLVVVNERDNTGVHCPDPSLLPMLSSFLVLPSCGVVAGHKNGEDRLAHRKGGRRDGFECRGNGVPVAQREVRHVENIVCLIDFQRKTGMENFKNFIYQAKSISGKHAPSCTAAVNETVGRACMYDTVGR
jgi:hypothetical protein